MSKDPGAPHPTQPEDEVLEGWVKDPHQAALFTCAVEAWKRRQDLTSPEEGRCLHDAGMALICTADALVQGLSGERIPDDVLEPLISVVMNVLLYVYRRGGGAKGLRAEDIHLAAASIVREVIDFSAGRTRVEPYD